MARSRKSAAAAGEASGKRGADGSAADVPQGDEGVAAASAPSSRPLPDLRCVGVVASRIGVCLHYEQDGVLLRENLTEEKCQERVAALAHDETAVALWSWKLKQVAKGAAPDGEAAEADNSE